MMVRRVGFLVLGCCALMLLTAFASAAPQAPARAASAHATTLAKIQSGKITSSTSGNWAGYGISGKKGSVTDVKGTWVVPSMKGRCPSTASYSVAFWIGIDGMNSSTVEQTGMDLVCYHGTVSYYSWREFYPLPFITLTIVVHAGDKMSAEVSYQASTKVFTTSLTDVTTGKTSAHSRTFPSAVRSSAEWIVEDDSGGGATGGITPYGTVTFRNAHATISGTTASISGFTKVFAITMTDSPGTDASPSGLSFGGTTFTVTWKSR
ncbi:MAG: G1 family endopeptidase [Thermoplasmata archaeon]|nr:G1 family endopeptidase [Thermoplasmata archaeon]